MKIKTGTHIRIAIRAAACAALLMLLPSCGIFQSRIPAAGKVVLITLDTTRADRLGCYGYKDIETPNLDTIASEGVLFENATCQVPMTIPSHATIMTGLYPPNHGVRNNTGYVLSDKMKTVAEILSEKGYRTGAAVSAFVVSSEFGMAQGFDNYDEKFEEPSEFKGFKWVERKSKGTIDAAIDWFKKNKDENKLFYWLHLYDPHADYIPPEPFVSKYKGHLYDGEIAYMDSELGRFFKYLKSINSYDDALFIIVGDHGEGLGEHGEGTHEILVYDSTMKVPFMIRSRSFKNSIKVKADVSTVDIFPTIMEACRINDHEKVDGRSLIPLLNSPTIAWNEPSYFESMAGNILYGWSQLKGVRKEQWKYIDCPVPELYDCKTDPQEKHTIVSENGEIAEQCKELLRDFDSRWRNEDSQKSAKKNLDEEALEKLMSLGYVGGSSAITSSSSKNPIDFIEIHEKLHYVYNFFFHKKFEEGIRLLEEIYPRDKENKLIIFYFAMAYHEMKNNDEARRYLEILLTLYPDHLLGYQKLAEINMQERRWDALEETLQKAITYFPDEADFQYKFALILLAKQKPEEALEHIEEAIDLSPDNGSYHLLASKCHLMLGEKVEAIREIEKADKAGIGNYSIISRDPAFRTIINDPAIQKILQKNN